MRRAIGPPACLHARWQSPRRAAPAHGAARRRRVGQLGGVGLQELAARRRRENSSRTSTLVPAHGRLLCSSPLRRRCGGRGRHRRPGWPAASRTPRRWLPAPHPGSPWWPPTSSVRLAILLVAWRLRAAAVARQDAAAIVFDDDAAHAARHQRPGSAGAGVQGVVHQLAHHRGGALDHLAGGDLADQFIGQFADRAAARCREHGSRSRSTLGRPGCCGQAGGVWACHYPCPG